MAGDWIKMRSDLRRHPKVVRIASALNADKLRVVGGLHAVWTLFDEHSEDGVLWGYTPSALDDEIGWPGFASAMTGVGWLSSDGADGLLLPEFETHNGASAKRRAQEALRKKEQRTGRFVSDDASASCPQAVGKTAVGQREQRREEKRREEDSSSLRSEERSGKRSKPPKCPEGVAESTWADWLHLRRTKKAPVTETVLKAAIREAEKAGMPLQRFLEIWCMRGSQGLQADWLRADERNPTPGPNGLPPSFAERDREAGMQRWEQMTGQVHPDRKVVDLPPPGTRRLT